MVERAGDDRDPEYLAVLNHYYVAKHIEPLRDLFVRLAVEQLTGE